VPEALSLGVRLNQGHVLVRAAGEAQVLDAHGFKKNISPKRNISRQGLNCARQEKSNSHSQFWRRNDQAWLKLR
jgi:hypothetical protein